MSQKESFVTPLPKDHPLYKMVGRVASEWSHVEHRLDTIIWALSGTTNERCACITSQIMGVPNRCNAITTLGSFTGISENALKLVNKVKGRSFQIVDDRNRLIHDPWYMEYPAGMAAQFKAMPLKNTHYGLKPVTEAEINKIIQTIKEFGQMAMDARKAVLAELKALRGKSA